MVAVNVHDIIAERAAELSLKDRGAEPPLNGGFVKDRRGILVEGLGRLNMKPLARPTGTCEVKVCASFVVRPVLLLLSKCVAVQGGGKLLL